MIAQFITCLKAWGAGMIIMSFPVFFFSGKFHFGSENWKTFLSVFCVLFPALLLFQFLVKYPFFKSRYIQLLMLVAFILLSEFEFFMLPYKITQVYYLESWEVNVSMVVFAFIAAYVVLNIVLPRKHLVIVQKDI